jgi:hypothetical protein
MEDSMRKLLSALLIGFFAITSNAAQTDAPTTQAKTWTFLIYLNGNNSLDEFGAVNIKDMEKVGSNDQVNIIVEWASLSAHKTVRMLIKKSPRKTKSVYSPVLENLGRVDMGNVETLKDFIAWGVKNYPADHYFIDVWNHGSGWHAMKAASAPTKSALDISWDDNTDHSISTEKLGQALAYAAKIIGHKVDIYGSDACLMAMAEVANEMTDSVAYFVGSQEVEPGAGWPYNDLLSRWEATPNATPEEVSKILVDVYVKSYERGNPYKEEVTFSAYDLSKLSALNAAVANFGTKLAQLSPSDRANVLSISRKVQRFSKPDYADLMDFVNQLAAANIRVLTQEDIGALQAASKDVIIANAVTNQYAKATGLSIWLPTNISDYKRYSTRYQGLQFNARTHWNDALSSLLQGAHNE